MREKIEERWWAAAVGRLLWAAAGAAAGGQETPKVPVLPVCASVCQWPGQSKKALYSEKPEN